jgi:ADP-ribose pyrophosphatase YjhB (NUDIX family)
MKLHDFTLPTDGQPHNYCINCFAETIRQIEKDGRGYFLCDTCGKTSERNLHFDDRKYWLAEDGELWHETAAVFVRNPEGKFLFFERTLSPFGFTIPAGHIDVGEDAETAAHRELEEEVGVTSTNLHLAVETEIVGDKCSSGADAHAWHVYIEDYIGDGAIEVKEEGENPVWLTLDEVAGRETPFAIRYLLDHHRAALGAN